MPGVKLPRLGGHLSMRQGVTMKPVTKPKTTRRRSKYTDEFKAGALRLVAGGRPPAEVARDLGVHPASMYNWVRLAAVDAGQGPAGALKTDEREELAALRKENRVLKLEREILRKLRPSLPRRTREVRVHRG